MTLSAYTCFDGPKRLVAGSLHVVVLAAGQALAGDAAGPVLLFDNDTGRSIDVDLRGTEAEIMARYGATSPGAGADPSDAADQGKRGRGRPALGVVAREVT